MDINILEKQIRSQVIKQYLIDSGIKGAVCFSCGNSTKFLREAGVDVIGIGEKEELVPTVWFPEEKVKRYFPDRFNATSGNLPILVMYEIARRLRIVLGEKWKPVPVKIGSGETALALILAYPEKLERFKFYRDGTPATAYNENAPLNAVLRLLLSPDLFPKKK